ncbi:amino acid ABC transporter permease [Sinomonas terrae]|uniref:Amino acid ABC transporter permease n=1 Tax=Sinomonas terrae TaxID=2908838 RepID=A0ABS9TYE8_9MICC|nr:amino acid ABC transporter permease [Sinomonas terrae]MCH6469449.1 amino acid ABC transporter permease [Sinomonas terrae]HKU10203.1 amino acid ABC transporter permease [Sinomonas sp.]
MQELFTTYLPELLAGLWMTARLTAVSFVGSLVLGTVAAGFRISPIVPLRAVGRLYVELFVNIPLISLLVVVTFGLPDIGITFDLFTCAALSMALLGGAFTCEAIRTGVNAVSVGQIEAARSIGLDFFGVLRHVLFPQAYRSVVQPLVNVFIGILLSSSLAGVIGVKDLTLQVSEINNQAALGLTAYMVAAFAYVVISLLAGGFGAWLEKRWRVQR